MEHPVFNSLYNLSMGFKKMILATIIVLIIIFLDSTIQAYLIKSGVWINHTISALIAILYCFGIAYFCINGTWKILAGTLFLLSVRWFWFDLILNVWRGKDFYYIGDIDKEDAKSDNLLHKLPEPEYQQYFLKIGLIFLTFILYIII